MNLYEILIGSESSIMLQFCNPDLNVLFIDYDVIWFDWISALPHVTLSYAPSLLETTHLEQFIDNIEDLSYFNNLENIQSIYHYSVPTTKLAYPEPYIASASFLHSDLWFVHILIYQYWLWFVFIFIIVFFFVTFLCTVRWCNMRVRPRRETRGVSRSKCGDLITACVPVSWAASIIINESTDAIDYYDGFGTTELVIGIRAYQWGWEYYYPKDIDLNYNIKRNYSAFIGNSLKYNSVSDKNLKINNFWKYYQNKLFDQVNTPSSLLLLPQDNTKILNLLTFNDIGANALVESNAFKRTRAYFKNNVFGNFNSYNYFNTKYRFLNPLINKNISWEDTTSFGIKRQHTFLVNQLAFNEVFSLNCSSFSKFLSFNYNVQTSHVHKSVFDNLKFFNFSNSLSTDHYYFLLDTLYKNLATSEFHKLFMYKNLKFFFNNDSDKKKLSKPFNKSVLHFKTHYFNNEQFSKNFHNTSYNFYTPQEFFSNFSRISKTFENFSSNQSVLTNSKFIRKHINALPTKPFLNLNSSLNTWVNNENYFEHATSSGLSVYNFNRLKWLNTDLLLRLGTNKIYLDSPHPSIPTNTSFFSPINYDYLKNTHIENLPTMFQSKEDLFPAYLFSTYWNFMGSNTSSNHRVLNMLNLLLKTKNFYLPLFSLYYDYDFRNWQALELLEDNFWETQVNTLNFDEYKDLSGYFYEYVQLKKSDKFYLILNKTLRFKNNILITPYELGRHPLYFNFSYGIYNDETINSPQFTTLLQFNNYYVLSNIYNLEDTYETLKNFSLASLPFNKNLINFNNKFITTVHTNYLFDWFRSNYEDFSWFHSTFYLNQDPQAYKLNYGDDLRFNYHYNLRSTVKNSIVNFNAIQKVFKSRLDDARSHSKLIDLSHLSTPQPFLTASRPKYEKLIGKTKDLFFDSNYYLPQYKHSLSANFFNFLNFAVFDFPFLLGQKSDSARHVWVDWYSKWGFYEVQPSSSSKYSIHGMPYFNKFFEFTYEQNDVINETETYFVRLSKARRNYLQNWIYTPYFFARNSSWNKQSVFWSLKNNNIFDGLMYQLDHADFFWTDIYIFNNYNLKFLPSLSNVNSFTKSTWRPVTDIAHYYYSFSVLNDILTVREYLYRELFSNTNKLLNLPNILTARSTSTLVNDLKSTFFYFDPLIANNEYSKDIYYNSLEYFNFNIFKSWINYKLPISFQNIFNNFYYFVFSNYYTDNNELLYKNQFRPLRKGINNMLRLHATGAVAMPIEIRLQILASSKDVIHSWAVPSAGIKIDCVPGYSSHKVMIFLVSGIFWGQCMEICGRYHHWMPIVVYFMKRDLFFLWCTHFVFLSGANNIWTINDRQFVDYIKVVSYDKHSWINEIH